MNIKKLSNLVIPITIFQTKLSPLEAITRYLKDCKNLKLSEISKLLSKDYSSVFRAYKKSQSKKFDFSKADLFIPLSVFVKNFDLSILENVVLFLRNKNLKFREIAEHLDRSPKTIWTLYNRACKKRQDSIPVSIFATELSPLEALVRYLKENLNKKTSEISKLLDKFPSVVSLAYKKSLSKDFIFSETDLFIPLSEFEKNSDLSVLEIVVSYLRSKNLKLKEIAKLLNKSPKTIWTLLDRASKKKSRRYNAK